MLEMIFQLIFWAIIVLSAIFVKISIQKTQHQIEVIFNRAETIEKEFASKLYFISQQLCELHQQIKKIKVKN